VIPSDASVLTQNDLFPHIDRRLYVYAPLANPTGNISTNITFDHIFVDTTSPWYTDSLRKIVSDVAEDGSFGIQYSHEGILLLKEGYKGATLDPVRDGN
jgi:uncharacterized membrane protein